MSCSEAGSLGIKRHSGTGCCGSNCASETAGCLASEPRIRTCLCQENTGCIERGDCGGFHPRGTAATGACPGPCQCAEEEAWNRNAPPKPNCEWYSNFSELRRQWSDHARQHNCKCCNCKPCRTAPPCKPCLPPPDTSNSFSDPNQSCCNDRLSGGANGKSSCCQRDNSPSPKMPSASGYYSSSYEDPDEEDDEEMCKPCSPAPRPTLKPRSCCQCIPGYCMCQPMPRNCNCPPPVQVDARAARDCECECPSSPECACPPSERRFPRTKVQCPNARMCCSTPRPQPGPKCNCTKCQPCLPPPCDPCTSSKCRAETPSFKPCDGGSPCDDAAPCRPEPPKLPPCQPTPPCNECRKMAPSCRPPLQVENYNESTRQFASAYRSRIPGDFKYSKNSASFRPAKIKTCNQNHENYLISLCEKPRVHDIPNSHQSQNVSNRFDMPLDLGFTCTNLKSSDFTLLRLLEHFWQLGKSSEDSCFEESLLRDGYFFVPKWTSNSKIKVKGIPRNDSSETVSLDNSMKSVSSQEKGSSCRRSKNTCDDVRNTISNLNFHP